MSSAAPQLDAFGRDYLRLTLEIDKHIDGYIDAYYGPEALKAEVSTSTKKPATALIDAVAKLQDHIPDADPSRAAYLTGVLRAIDCTTRILNGETLDYLDEIERIYDIRPVLVDETVFQEAHQALDPLLPACAGMSLGDRLTTWRKQFEVSGEGVVPLLELARSECRVRTLQYVELPDDESVEIRLTNHQPWGAYNWYKGNAHSLIEFNTDIPLQVTGLINTFAHEGYPGHHTEHLLKENRLYRQRGYAEQAAALLHSPSAVIAEGIATTALEVIFPDTSHHEWNQTVMFPAAGLPDDGSLFDQIKNIEDITRPLRYVVGNAAILYHTGRLDQPQTIDYIHTYGLVPPERANKSFSFISHPLFRAYIFTYSAGYDLLHQATDLNATFLHLLSNQVLPSQLGHVSIINDYRK